MKEGAKGVLIVRKSGGESWSLSVLCADEERKWLNKHRISYIGWRFKYSGMPGRFFGISVMSDLFETWQNVGIQNTQNIQSHTIHTWQYCKITTNYKPKMPADWQHCRNTYDDVNSAHSLCFPPVSVCVQKGICPGICANLLKHFELLWTHHRAQGKLMSLPWLYM